MKKTVFLIIAILCAWILTGCTAQMPEEEIPVSADASLSSTGIIYCTDGKYLIPVSTEAQLGENVPEQLIKSMQSLSDEALGLTSLIPESASVTVTREGRTAKVSITGDTGQMNARQVVCSVVNTLTQYDGIDAVSFSVNGLSEDFGGVDITSPISEYCINPAYDIGNLEPFQVFFQNDAGLIIPMTKATNNPSAEVYIKALMTVPDSASELSSLFPDGTTLNSAVLTDDGTLSLDFSGEFYGVAAMPDAEKNLLAAIDATCRQLQGVERISIYVDGTEYSAQGKSMSVFANTLS